jgi:hypothetical protein
VVMEVATACRSKLDDWLVLICFDHCLWDTGTCLNMKQRSETMHDDASRSYLVESGLPRRIRF